MKPNHAGKFAAALDELYGFEGNLKEFPAFLSALLVRCLDVDVADYGEFNRSTNIVGSAYCTPGSDYEARVTRYVPFMRCHPVFAVDPATYGTKALGNRDFFSDAQFHAMPIYIESMHADRLRHFLNICIPIREWVVSTGVYRTGRHGFRQSDQSLFAALRPHIERAYKFARRRTLDRMDLLDRIDCLFPQLGLRQRQVLHGIACGQSNAEIAVHLGIEINTVKFHLKQLFGTLGVGRRTDAALLVHRPDNDTFVPSR